MNAPEPQPAAAGSNGVPAILVRDLHRHFGSLKAVDGVSFAIDPGQVVGFVGANGAGKTTTMRIMATLDYPNRGLVEVCGVDVVQFPAAVRSKIGWMPDSFGTYDNMTVLEYLDFFARALGYRGEDRAERVRDVMDFTDLAPLADRLINKLSKGMGQRLCLGRALIHDPEVLILDEPAAGLDPKARVELKRLIRILADDGKTVFISSHILSELGEMCDSLLFINHGKIIHHGSSESLKRSTTGSTLIDVQVANDPARLAEWAEMSPQVTFREARKNGARLEIESLEPETVAAVLRRMVNDGIEVIEFHREERKLEDAFIEILGELENSGGVDRGGETGTADGR
ncbi:MAG: ABC transporter ATP-binding protein [Verrucomicrobiae bacterium]|nr:ABC transporter ATP-binding protein [Verrucomicrobiae bacterium]MCP5550432.1 ABC transporter ATP-binding protein [Akkermansiaceae bacterium]